MLTVTHSTDVLPIQLWFPNPIEPEESVMSNSQRLYHTVTRVIRSQCSALRVTQTRNLAWFIVGVVLAAHCQLTQIAPHLPWEGNRDSLVQRLRRVLMNQRLAVRTLYGPTVGYILQWLNTGQPLVLVIDRTTL